MEYIDALNGGDKPEGGVAGCFLCHHRDDATNDRKNLVLWRGRKSFVVLNRFPYTGGHSMIAPYEHVGDLASVDDQAMLEIMQFLRDMQAVLSSALRCEGFNIGINVGRCAGAGLPGHLHVHIVPRWSGDTNFMPVFGGVRVIPQTLESLYDQLKKAGQESGLPKVSQQ